MTSTWPTMSCALSSLVHTCFKTARVICEQNQQNAFNFDTTKMQKVANNGHYRQHPSCFLLQHLTFILLPLLENEQPRVEEGREVSHPKTSIFWL